MGTSGLAGRQWVHENFRIPVSFRLARRHPGLQRRSGHGDGFLDYGRSGIGPESRNDCDVSGRRCSRLVAGGRGQRGLIRVPHRYRMAKPLMTMCSTLSAMMTSQTERSGVSGIRWWRWRDLNPQLTGCFPAPGCTSYRAAGPRVCRSSTPQTQNNSKPRSPLLRRRGAARNGMPVRG